ncbi:hypothetical protein [Kaistia terrae]|uniref:Uncharacterized protein n=1 Tax=Kaistia terrae TaxID=537017 RepID=A0ABW0Q373_9HYPH|nr:hypothetical protein [Kaistia terrae]MCX5581527.1 hypothetical protein [Kaistia terrae]
MPNTIRRNLADEIEAIAELALDDDQRKKMVEIAKTLAPESSELTSSPGGAIAGCSEPAQSSVLKGRRLMPDRPDGITISEWKEIKAAETDAAAREIVEREASSSTARTERLKAQRLALAAEKANKPD